MGKHLQVEYRAATEDDLERVASLYRLWEIECCTRGLTADTSGDLRSRLGPYFIVASFADHITGFAIARETSEYVCVFPAAESYLVLDDLYVHPDHRGHGIASALVAAIMETGRQRGVHRFITYSANKDWQTTLEFYRRLGFGMWSFALFLDEAGSAKSKQCIR